MTPERLVQLYSIPQLEQMLTDAWKRIKEKRREIERLEEDMDYLQGERFDIEDAIAMLSQEDRDV